MATHQSYVESNETDLDSPGSAFCSNCIFIEVVKILVPIIIFLLVLVGVVGHGMVLFVIGHHRDMKTITNYFIANLAVSDVAFLIACAIPTALNISGVLNMEVAMCKGINYLIYVTVQATCLTLTAMSIDRYDLIVNAVKSRKRRTTTKALMTNIAVWLGSFVLHIPVAVYSNTQSGACDTVFDTESGVKAFHIVATLTMYLGPLLIYLGCYVSILITVWRKTWKGTASAMAHARSIYRKRKITRIHCSVPSGASVHGLLGCHSNSKDMVSVQSKQL